MFAIIRNCCTSGNCIVCRGKTPLGTPVRIEHMRVEDEKKAEVVAQNYALYKAEVKEVR